MDSEKLQTAFQKAKVTCMDGQMRQLKQVYLAIPAVVDEPLVRNAVPMLAVNDAKDEKWLEFHRFGLNTSPNVRLYLTMLENIRSRAPENVNITEVQNVYNGMRLHNKGSHKLIR